MRDGDVPRVDFVVPGPLGFLSGGSRFDARIVAGLRGLGWRVAVHELPGRFPETDDRARRGAETVMAAGGTGTLIIDGLALPAFDPPMLAARAVIALVHHPLALETGLAPASARHLARAETVRLAACAGVIATSPTTGRDLVREYRVPAARLRVVVPGTDRAAPSRFRRRGGPLRVLSVGAAIPRKGHADLIRALGRVRAPDWRLTVVGPLDRDPGTTAALSRMARGRHGGRVTLAGAVSERALRAAYRRADLFALNARFEGYGMAFAEALRSGLPVLGTTGGAIRETVPATAGLLVPPGDLAALTRGAERLLRSPALRLRLALGARAAGRRFPTWADSAVAFAEALGELSR